MIDDAELLRRYAEEKSEAAFAELVRRHLDLVYSTALRRLAGDAHLAQDVAQSVFTALARKASSLTDRTTLAGWLYLGAHHTAAQAVRGEQRRRAREQEAHTMHEQFSPSDAATDWDRVRPVLDEALRDLNDADREAVLLRYFERRPFAEIGASLNLSEDAARMRVDRALEKLRALLARRDVTSTAAALAAALANQAMVAAPAGLAATIAGAAIATGAATATTGFFMSTTTLVTSAVTVAALVAAIFEVSQTHRAEAELAALTRDRDGLHAQLRDMQQRATTAEQQGAALQRDLEVARTAKAAVAVAVPAKSFSGPQTPAGNPAIEGRVAFRAIPAGTDPAEARRQVKTLNLENRDYSHLALYRQLGFTPAQHEQFKTLMADYMERGDEQTRAAFAAAMAQSPKPDRAALQPVFEAAAKQNDEEWQAAMRGTFGDAMLQSFQHYRDTIPGREVTKELSSALFYTDNPLTVPQAEQLVEIIAANSRNAQGKVDLAAMNGDAILAQAQAVLSAPQLAALRRAQLQVRQNWAPAGAKPSGG